MSTKYETIRLENSTYNILSALGKEAQFLYSTIDTYISDAEKDSRSNLVEIWKTMKTREPKACTEVERGLGKRSA